MIRIESTEVWGFEAAARGARNPMNSWKYSDSKVCDSDDCASCEYAFMDDCGMDQYRLGPADLGLLGRLSKAGTDHGKFMRMIHVQVDITAPLYWWKEADQYKVATTTNSCSTMHKIHDKKFEIDDFSVEKVQKLPYSSGAIGSDSYDFAQSLRATIRDLNMAREMYQSTKDKELQRKYWDIMIQLLPSSYNQRRTWDVNYATLKNIFNSRKQHKLTEWRELCEWILTLPYMEELL